LKLKTYTNLIKLGATFCVMGLSGSGKSTLVRHFNRLLEPTAGKILIDGIDVMSLGTKKLQDFRNEKISMVFQNFALLPHRSVLDNVAMPLYYQGIGRKDRNEKALHYLSKVGLADWAGHLPNELSGGQKQRVAIARALASEPKVLLADEPTGALDTKTSYEVMELIQGINDEGKTILIVTHEPDIAAMTKRIVNLKDGVIIDDTKVKQVKASANV